jgi:hypothetical protein
MEPRSLISPHDRREIGEWLWAVRLNFGSSRT